MGAVCAKMWPLSGADDVKLDVVCCGVVDRWDQSVSRIVTETIMSVSLALPLIPLNLFYHTVAATPQLRSRSAIGWSLVSCHPTHSVRSFSVTVSPLGQNMNHKPAMKPAAYTTAIALLTVAATITTFIMAIAVEPNTNNTNSPAHTHNHSGQTSQTLSTRRRYTLNLLLHPPHVTCTGRMRYHVREP